MQLIYRGLQKPVVSYQTPPTHANGSCFISLSTSRFTTSAQLQPRLRRKKDTEKILLSTPSRWVVNVLNSSHVNIVARTQNTSVLQFFASGIYCPMTNLAFLFPTTFRLRRDVFDRLPEAFRCDLSVTFRLFPVACSRTVDGRPIAE